MKSHFEVSISSSISDFAPDAWNRISRTASFFSSRAWLTYAEQTTSYRMAYIAVYDGGHLAAAVPAWLNQPAAGGLFDFEAAFPGFAPADPTYLLLGPPKAYRAEFLFDPARAERPAIAAALVAGARTAAAEAGAAGCLGLHFAGPTASLIASVLPDRAAVLVDADARIDVPATFDDYLAALPSKRRIAVRREIRAFDEAGYDVEIRRLGEVYCEVAPLVVNLERKYGVPADTATMTGYLELQARLYDDRTTVVVARRDGAVRAACVLYTHEDSLTARMAGLDYPALAGAYEYFNVVYYAALRHASERGYRRLHLGLTALEAKLARGASVEPLWAMDLSEKRLWGDQEAIRLSADRAGLLRRQCRSHPAALVADDLFHALEPSETGEIWNCTN